MPFVARTALAALAVAAAFGAAGCASAGKVAPSPAAVAAAPVKREDFLALLNGGVPDQLKNHVEVRDYKFAPGKEPRVSMEVYNPSATDALSFEIRTLFFREDSTLVDATEWTAGAAPPRGTFLYRAQSFSPWSAKEQVQMRMVRAGAGS